MTLSDGKTTAVKASSAGEAIETALRNFRGRKVKTCHSGTDQQGPYKHGVIHYDVPPHRAIPEGVVFQKATRRKEDNTAPMFDDTAIVEESRRALSRS
jgi:hypothetical protein